MKNFTVRLNISIESNFDVEIEADSHEEAEQIAKDMIWDDELTGDITANSEITDERYDATQEFVCSNCNHHFTERQMTDKEACPKCDTPIPDNELLY
jgi:rubrerythrin